MSSSKRKATTSTHKGALFWPHIYLPNLTRERYPKLLGMYGSPGKVMKAEKQHIIKALGYHVLCRAEKSKDDCFKVQERRHHAEKHHASPHSKTPAYHICRYTHKKGCTTREALTKLSLQFLRWLLFQTDEDAFLSYVKSFPHQVTEKDYGYDHETGKRVMSKKEVVEIKRSIVSASPKQYKTIPVGYLREVQQALAPRISTKAPIRSLKAQPTQVIGKTTQKRLKHAMFKIDKLEGKLQEAEDLINYYIKENKTLMDNLNQKRLKQTATEKELKEIKEDVAFCNRDLDYATQELDKCSLLRAHCSEATATLKELQEDFQNIPKRKAIRKATEAAIASAVKAASERIAQPHPDIEAMDKLRSRLQKGREDILRDNEATDTQLIKRFVEFYNEVFDEDFGVLIEALLAKEKE